MPPFVFFTMYGSNGCGKTHLAHAIGNAMLRRGFRVKMCPAGDLLNKYKQGIEEEDGRNNAMLRGLIEIDVLIIDDLAAEYFKTWSQEIWEFLIDGRYNRAFYTVITTNNNIDRFPDRISSRLRDKDMSRLVMNTALDYRITQGKGGQKP
jgi:DNA replication protein DnaC